MRMATKERDKSRDGPLVNLEEPLQSAVLSSLFFYLSIHDFWLEMVLMNQEFVRALRLDLPRRERIPGKILQVERHDCLCAATHRGG